MRWNLLSEGHKKTDDAYANTATQAPQPSHVRHCGNILPLRPADVYKFTRCTFSMGWFKVNV